MHSATMGTSLLEGNYKAYNEHRVLISPWIFFLRGTYFQEINYFLSYLPCIMMDFALSTEPGCIAGSIHMNTTVTFTTVSAPDGISSIFHFFVKL